MTPYAFRIFLEAQTAQYESERTRDITLAYNTAALSRANRLPKLSVLLAPKKQMQRIDGNAIFRRLDKYQQHRDKQKG